MLLTVNIFLQPSTKMLHTSCYSHSYPGKRQQTFECITAYTQRERNRIKQSILPCDTKNLGSAISFCLLFSKQWFFEISLCLGPFYTIILLKLQSVKKLSKCKHTRHYKYRKGERKVSHHLQQQPGMPKMQIFYRNIKNDDSFRNSYICIKQIISFPPLLLLQLYVTATGFYWILRWCWMASTYIINWKSNQILLQTENLLTVKKLANQLSEVSTTDSPYRPSLCTLGMCMWQAVGNAWWHTHCPVQCRCLQQPRMCIVKPRARLQEETRLTFDPH